MKPHGSSCKHALAVYDSHGSVDYECGLIDDPGARQCVPDGCRLFEPMAKLRLGRCVLTPGVADAGIDPAPFLYRHQIGDWGELCAEDAELNERALEFEGRVMSCFPCSESPDGRVWVITEADRSVTTVLLPSEY